MLFLLMLFPWPVIYTQLNLYDTDREIGTGPLKFDCLHYNVLVGELADQRLQNPTTQVIKYCLRPLTETNISIPDFLNQRDQNFTFEELRHLNVTVHQLLFWSAPVDLAERYLLYINQPIINVSSSTELFYNCTRFWFGSRCQYSFSFFLETIEDIVEYIFDSKDSFIEDVHYRTTNPSCYVHLKCDRGSPMCLDWREICNGQIDCIDGGIDEAQCFRLEMNECADDEYRCQNGLCIPGDFYNDEEAYPDCLDHSDEPNNQLSFDFCSEDPRFRCEERVCRSDSVDFACGDGECVKNFHYSCANGRNNLMKESLLAKGNLSNSCWLRIACHTFLTDEMDENPCESLFNSIDYFDISTCESLFQFPVIPVLYGHVRFLYDNNRSGLVERDTPLPDYVCYDEQLCNFIPPTFHYQNFTCRHRQQIIHTDLNYYDFFMFIKNYFFSCATPSMVANVEQYKQHPSMYCCKNSSKCISKYRLKDHIIDCHLGDDEEYALNCSLNGTYHFKCDDRESTCWSPSVDLHFCAISNQKQRLNEIFFQNICNGVVNILPQEISGQNYTDETECQYWPCNNIYTKCDSYKSCSDGSDEYGCLPSNCPLSFYPCVSLMNYTLICLPMNRVDDNIIDCLGAADERRLCFTSYDKNSVHDWNHTKCIPSHMLCDYFRNYPFVDDENFCENYEEICSQSWGNNRGKIEDIFCNLADMENKVNYFSLETTVIYPPSTENTSVVQVNQWQVENQISVNNVQVESATIGWAWRCNRGLDTDTWFGDEIVASQCFCPPSYYGDLCEYQNERVSLSLKLSAVDHRSLYAIIVMLMDENDHINSYEQFIFIGKWDCSKKFNIYLLYSTRPKDISKNYSVQIDVFDKYTLAYHGRWYLPIPFLFLPVNRIAANLIIPFQRVQTPRSCNLTCKNSGQCMRYVNIEKFFCRCLSNWSGSSCDIPINCHYCSTDSVCVGALNNRSICVCPENKIGPRCLIPSLCPPNACKNHGKCVSLRNNVNDDQFACTCPDPFYGRLCELEKNKLDIAFDNMEKPSHIVVYTIPWEPDGQLVTIVFVKKLLYDQHIVTLYNRASMNIVFVKFSANYYLVVSQQSSRDYISTSINANRRCWSIGELFNSSILTLPFIRRVKYYHLMCQNRSDLWCFFDEIYMCLCTLEHHANCFQFNHNRTLACRHNDFCQNGASCLQNDLICPSDAICICTDCYFGDLCQFYARGFGVTLDDILRYEVRRNLTFSQQRISVKISAAVTMLMFVLGLVNGICSYLTFRRKLSQQVGCGLYLNASSITSILIMIIFTMKFWFFILSQIDLILDRTILQLGCKSIEFFLKLFLYMDNWLNAFVAIERAYAVFAGVKFNKVHSKRVAKRIIFILPILIIITIIHEPLYRVLYDDEEEQRTWCVIPYSRFLHNYNSAIILIHFLVPFIINLISALSIIIITARQRSASQSRLTYQQHLRQQLAEHKHILISPIALVILSVPRLIISLISSCVKLSRDPRLYLVGYFISFIPSVLMFVIFVLPSDLYSKEFKESTKICQRIFRR